jgi:proline dehydrogenase
MTLGEHVPNLMVTLENQTKELGLSLTSAMRRSTRSPLRAAERRAMIALMSEPDLRAALFRFVDVRPACRNDAELGRHLVELLEDSGAALPAHLAGRMMERRWTRVAATRTASLAVQQLARRFIVGADPEAALPKLARLWRSGVAASVDLLGEATVTEAEADRYEARCAHALEVIEAASRDWPARPGLERDGSGVVPRVNLSVKVSALTPLLRPHAPERGARGAEARLRGLLRLARDVGAHLHIDMESFDSRETITDLTLALLAEEEFAEGPSAGIVLQGYLTDSPEMLDRLLTWCDETERASPLTIRLVKGAYWDHEVVQAQQHGWRPAVFTDRRACDRNFEALTRRLVDEVPKVRVAIASHNPRSIAHAAAYAEARSLAPGELEFQVLRGLGDDVQHALRVSNRRVRCYCPVGDLVSGMAYLVRRLLENTSNQSFVAAHASGEDIDTLLEAPR